MTTLGRPRKDERPPISPDDILRCAAVLFAARGYRATNLVHVAGELHITRQALYHYFPSKQAILLALVARLFDLFEAEAAPVAAEARAPLEQLRAQLAAHGRVVARHRALFAMLIGEQAELNMLDIADVKARDIAYREGIAAAYATARAAGVVRDVDPRVAVASLLGAIDALPRWFAPGCEQTPEEAAALAADLALEGLVT